MNKRKVTLDDHNKPFPSRLRLLLSERNVSQTELAEAFKDSGLTVTRQTISSYANGETTPDIERFKFIADFFGVSYDYLLGVSEAEKRDNIEIGKDIGLKDEAIDQLRVLRNSASRRGTDGAKSRRYLMAINLILSTEINNFITPLVHYAESNYLMVDQVRKASMTIDAEEFPEEGIRIEVPENYLSDISYNKWLMIEGQRATAERIAQVLGMGYFSAAEMESSIMQLIAQNK